MKISKWTFEGTPEEFERVRDSLDGQGAQVVDPDKMSAGTADFMRRLLTRRSVPLGQQALFKALYDAGEKGLRKTELAASTHRSESRLSGVLGALGRRINRTPGISEVYPNGGIGVLFDIRWVAGEWHYVMRPALRNFLESSNPEWLGQQPA